MNNWFVPLLAKESTSRLIWAIVLVILFIFVIFGIIGMLISKLMGWQGRAVDKMMHDVTVTRVIQNKTHFKKVASIKSRRAFFKQSAIPLIIMMLAGLFILLYFVISGNWGFNLFTDYGTPIYSLDDPSIIVNHEGGTSISTLFFIWDYSKPFFETTNAALIVNWPPVISMPHFSADAWPSYVFFGLMLPSTIWFLVTVQSFVARKIRIIILGRKIFDKNLENFRHNNLGAAPMKKDQGLDEVINGPQQ